MSLVQLKKIQKSFKGKNRTVITILRDIDLAMAPHETLCVVGESGCGKTTLGRILAGLLPYTEGTYEFDGSEVAALSGKAKRKFRQDVQLIHQNPYESLNPTMMIYDIIANPLKRHRGLTRTAELYEEVSRLLEMVGLTPVEDFVDKYPSRLSGGQRQRVSIARAFAMEPRLIVVDEATSMIDTSLRISLLTTLKEIQARTGVSYFFITHDLALGRYFAQDQKIMVMYLGRIIEKANTEDFIRRPAHPYSKAILSAAVGNSDLLEASTEFEKYSLKGADIPSFTNIPPGCPLHPRCPQMMPGICDRIVPGLITLEPGHTVNCHLYDEEIMKRPDAIPMGPDAVPGGADPVAGVPEPQPQPADDDPARAAMPSAPEADTSPDLLDQEPTPLPESSLSSEAQTDQPEADPTAGDGVSSKAAPDL